MCAVLVGVGTEEPSGVVSMASKDILPRPFLKWAGSKKQLLPSIRALIYGWINKGCSYDTFVDGFLGGGAVSFMVMNELAGLLPGPTSIEQIFAYDCNADLIQCFCVVQNNIDALVKELKRLEQEFRSAKDGQEYYLVCRKLFNDRVKCTDAVERASLLIFLNHTCFNGLYRVNSNGEFNVPYGHNKNAAIFSEELLRVDSDAFNKWAVSFTCADFSTIPAHCAKFPDRTIYYFDPPYRPRSTTSSFNKYNKNDFGEDEQMRLAQHCVQLCKSGASVIASNSDVGDDFYKKNYKGFKVDMVEAVRMVNADVSKRGKVSEVLLSKFKP